MNNRTASFSRGALRCFGVWGVASLVTLGLLVLAGSEPASSDEGEAESVRMLEGLLPSLVLDRVDGNRAVWRLSNYVQTEGGELPAEPAPVYIQFGFMGCAPCEQLAIWAAEELSEGFQLIYIHLDDVLLQPGVSPRNLWLRLYEFSQAPPYERYITIRRGNTALMNQLCGAGTPVPSALLVMPSGQVLALLLSPLEETARQQLRAFRLANETESE